MNPSPPTPPRHSPGYRGSPAVTIRWATPADERQVEVLAALDEAPVPAWPLLLAFVGDELWVAWSAGTGTAISDPFRPSAEVVDLVRERGRQLKAAPPRRARVRGAWSLRLASTRRT